MQNLMTPPKVSMQSPFTTLSLTFAAPMQQFPNPMLTDNMAEFITGTKPSLPLAVYTHKQEKCQMFAQDAGVPISEATMVTTGTKATLNCGGMELAWGKWNHCPLVNHKWNNWKLHWTAAFAETHNINQLIANNSAVANQAATKAKQAAMMAKSLDNLAMPPSRRTTPWRNWSLLTRNLQRPLPMPTPPSHNSASQILRILWQLHQWVQQTIIAHPTGQPQARLGPYQLLLDARL